MTHALWYTRCPARTAASVAIRRGWLDVEFAPCGIAMHAISDSSDPDTRWAHFSHDRPALFLFGDCVPPLQAMARRVELRIIGLNWHDRVARFYALPGRLLAALATCTPEALRSARIGLPNRRQIWTDWWRAKVLAGIGQFLGVSGLTRDDITVVPIDIDRACFDDATADAVPVLRLCEQMDVPLAPCRIALLRRKYEHLLAHGFLEKGYDVDAIIDHGPLRRRREMALG